MAILTALPELRHRPVTSGTERGRYWHGTTAGSVTKHWHSRNARPVGLGRVVEADRDTGRLGRHRGASVSSMTAKHRRSAISRRTIRHSAEIRPSSRNRPRSSIQW